MIGLVSWRRIPQTTMTERDIYYLMALQHNHPEVQRFWRNKLAKQCHKDFMEKIKQADKELYSLKNYE